MRRRLRLFFRITCSQTLPFALTPVCIGSALAWQHEKTFRADFFLLMLIGVLVGLLALCYVIPPPRLADSRYGMAELVIFIALSLLPILGVYYVQTGHISWSASYAALPFGLFTTTVCYFQRFLRTLRWRTDRRNGKITTLAGEYRMRLVGATLILLISLALLLTTLPLQIFPWYSAIAALTTPPVLLVLNQASRDVQHYRRLLKAIRLANVQTTLLLLIALLIRGSLGI